MLLTHGTPLPKIKPWITGFLRPFFVLPKKVLRCLLVSPTACPIKGHNPFFLASTLSQRCLCGVRRWIGVCVCVYQSIYIYICVYIYISHFANVQNKTIITIACAPLCHWISALGDCYYLRIISIVLQRTDGVIPFQSTSHKENIHPEMKSIYLHSTFYKYKRHKWYWNMAHLCAPLGDLHSLPATRFYHGTMRPNQPVWHCP